MTDVIFSGPVGGGAGGWNNPINRGDFCLLLNDVRDIAPEGTFTFSGLPAGRYQLVTYAVAPNGTTRTVSVTVAGSVTQNPQLVTGPMPGNRFELGITHCIHEIVVTNGTLSVNVQTATSAYLNGFQLVRLPEQTAVLLDQWFAELLGVRRKNSNSGGLPW